MISKYLSSISSSAAPGRGHQSMLGKANKPLFGAKLLLVALGAAAVAGAIVSGLMNAPQIQAQSAPSAGEPLPSFEVASVKRNRSLEDSSFHLLPNRLIVRNRMTYWLIEFAYGRDMGEFGFRELRDNQLVGTPIWMWSERYDIDAKVEDSLAERFGKDCGHAFFRGSCAYREQFLLMFQSLLADRFKLKVRRETKELPVYALVVANGGPKFSTSAPPDFTATAQNSTQPPAKLPPCPAGMGCFQAYTSMGILADWLSRLPQIGWPVIDQTGLKGGYDIKLQFSREQPESGNAGMDIFIALRQQLGLKLQSTKGPVESIVIDHIERPSEN